MARVPAASLLVVALVACDASAPSGPVEDTGDVATSALEPVAVVLQEANVPHDWTGEPTMEAACTPRYAGCTVQSTTEYFGPTDGHGEGADAYDETVYDDCGRPVEHHRNVMGEVVEASTFYCYDELGYLVDEALERWSSGTASVVATYTHNQLGKAEELRDPEMVRAKATWAYDARGHLAEYRSGDLRTAYTTDEEGRIVALALYDRKELLQVENLTYEDGRVTQWRDSDMDEVPDLWVVTELDEAGRPVREVVDDVHGRFTEVRTTSYDEAGRVLVEEVALADGEPPEHRTVHTWTCPAVP